MLSFLSSKCSFVISCCIFELRSCWFFLWTPRQLRTTFFFGGGVGRRLAFPSLFLRLFHPNVLIPKQGFQSIFSVKHTKKCLEENLLFLSETHFGSFKGKKIKSRGYSKELKKAEKLDLCISVFTPRLLSELFFSPPKNVQLLWRVSF